MKDFALDKITGDLDVSSLDMRLLDGAERVRQQVYIKLNLWRGEWFLNTEFGTPYLEEILGKAGVTVGAARAAIIASVSEVDGVAEILTFDYDFDAKQRKLSVTMRIRTNYGIIKVSDVYGNS